ncbi:MAG: YkgJ family cysteine cluster protein [Desulfovibrionaceae bacterium]
MSDTLSPDCPSCGACCRQGGPVLHREDAPLVGRVLPLSSLVTLRAGELTYDPVTAQLLPLESEVIKIQGTGAELNPWQCVFLEGEAHCRIYADRPAQCSSLLCQNTAALEELYKHGRLTREDILADAPEGWLGLARTHEEECSLPLLVPLARQAITDSTASHLLLEAQRFDTAFRELCIEKAQVPFEVLPCLLGRPLEHFLASFGLAFVHHGHDIELEKVGVRVYP